MTFKLESRAESAETLRIWEMARIESLSLAAPVKKFTLTEGFVRSLIVNRSARIGEVSIGTSIVQECLGASRATFEAESVDTAMLLQSSAANSHAPDLLADASYAYSQQRRALYKSWRSCVASHFMEITCGFGFKPLRTLFAALAVWLSWALMYFALTNYTHGGVAFDGLKEAVALQVLGRCLYFSAIALTTVGFGDVTPAGPLSMLLAGVEGAVGVVLFALLVFSLSKRFST